MAIRDLLLPELDQEMAGLRRSLERVPLDRPEWKPHERSMTLGYLACHLASLPSWVVTTLEGTELDVAPPGGKPLRAPTYSTREELLEAFDANVAAARAAIAAASDEDFSVPWTLKQGGEPILTLPRFSVVRSMVLNHAIHHRAQLSVYLRLNDIPVPALYGPSADESA